MEASNQVRVGVAMALLALFVVGIVYRPILWLFIGLCLIGLLLLFLYVSNGKSTRGSVSVKPSHAALNRAQRSSGRSVRGPKKSGDDDANPVSNANQIALLVIGIIIGFAVLALS